MRQSYVLAKNRPSPYNERDYIEAYKKAVPSANGSDLYDIAAVITDTGIRGHALMKQSDNRSHDNQYHACYNLYA